MAQCNEKHFEGKSDELKVQLAGTASSDCWLQDSSHNENAKVTSRLPVTLAVLREKVKCAPRVEPCSYIKGHPMLPRANVNLNVTV